MAQPKLQAQFFVARDGSALARSRPLRRSEAFAFYQSSNKACAHCGVPVRFGGITVSPFDRIRAGHIDHIVPRSRGGQNIVENLQVLCISCNASKGARINARS